MKLRRGEIITLIITILSWLIGWYFYPSLPTQMASHWNAAGEVNGYMPKFWGTFLMPMISVFCWLIFLIAPRLDPKKDNIAKFRNTFDKFIILLFLFLTYLYLITLYWNLGFVINIIFYLIPAFAILFGAAGELIGQAEMNWSIGIRTPWTLSNQEVWTKTHILGKKLFQLAASLGLFGFVWIKYAIWFVLIPVCLAAVISIVYSYMIFRRLTTKDNRIS